MSFLEAFKHQKKQSASKAVQVGNSVAAGNRLNLADQLRFRQMERMLQQTLDELEQTKARISQLEKTLAEHKEHHIAVGESSPEHPPASLTPLLPIAEISQLAEMAKRFK